MTTKETLSYKDAGVDIAVADSTKTALKSTLHTQNPRVLNTVGAFSALFDGSFPELKHPVLVLKMEEPGSKQLLAAQHNQLPSIGYDLVNHLINDVVVMGARPLAILDCIICGKLEKQVVLSLVETMAEACRAQGCDLVGGETSEQPRVIDAGAYILTASCLGVVDKDSIIDGSKIKSGDAVVAVASNGVHTNGYTLVRSLLERDPELANEVVGNGTFLSAVLCPHLCYSNAIQECCHGGGNAQPALEIHGLAHITGGGIPGNLNRILPSTLDAQVDLSTIQILDIFRTIRTHSKNSDADMLQSFNLGVGLVAVLAPEKVNDFARLFTKHGHETYQIGTIVPGSGLVKTSAELRW